MRVLFHRGKRTIFWCGGDILALKKSLWRYIIPRLKARHICEHSVEESVLRDLGIKAEIHPMIFDVPIVKNSYIAQDKIHVYMCVHLGREKEYGIDTVERLSTIKELEGYIFHIYGIMKEDTRNIRYHGKVSPEKFAYDIEHYHCGLRLNEFEGLSEVTARSVLLAQYPISRMYFPNITYAPDFPSLVKELVGLKNKTKPNLIGQKYWTDKLEQSLNKVLK